MLDYLHLTGASTAVECTIPYGGAEEGQTFPRKFGDTLVAQSDTSTYVCFYLTFEPPEPPTTPAFFTSFEKTQETP